MTFPLQMTLRGARQSPALEEVVRKRAAKLETHCRDIQRMRVIFEVRDREQPGRATCDAMVLLGVPGDCIVVREHCGDCLELDARACVNRIFRQVERALRKHERVRRTRFASASGLLPVGLG